MACHNEKGSLHWNWVHAASVTVQVGPRLSGLSGSAGVVPTTHPQPWLRYVLPLPGAARGEVQQLAQPLCATRLRDAPCLRIWCAGFSPEPHVGLSVHVNAAQAHLIGVRLTVLLWAYELSHELSTLCSRLCRCSAAGVQCGGAARVPVPLHLLLDLVGLAGARAQLTRLKLHRICMDNCCRYAPCMWIVGRCRPCCRSVDVESMRLAGGQDCGSGVQRCKVPMRTPSSRCGGSRAEAVPGSPRGRGCSTHVCDISRRACRCASGSIAPAAIPLNRNSAYQWRTGGACCFLL